MEQSQSIAELAKALNDFQAKMESVPKNAVNPFYKSKYADLEAIITAVKPHLAEYGLSFSQLPDGDGLTTIIMHDSGEYLKATFHMLPKENTPQGQGSAITYAKRYALSAALGIATDDDDDGNAASMSDKPVKAPVAVKTAPTAKKERQVYMSPAAREQQAKIRIAKLVDKIKGETPEATTPEDKRAYYGDAVQELTSLSVELATVEELEHIGELLSKIAYPEN